MKKKVSKIKLLSLVATIIATTASYAQTNVFPTPGGVTMLNNGAGYGKGNWRTAAIVQLNNTYNNSSEFIHNRDMRLLQYGDGGAFGGGISWNLAPQIDNTFTSGFYSTQQFLLSSVGRELTLAGSSSGYSNTNQPITLSNIMTWTGTGNVGIGTTAPNAKLHIPNGEAIIGGGASLTPTLNATLIVKAKDDASSTYPFYVGLNSGSDLLWVRGDGNGYFRGNVGIGTTNPTQKLSVNGTIQAKEIIVNTGWSDFVFDNNYKLRPLTEVEQFVKINKHLPEIPSQKEVEKNGVQLGDISSKLLMKIEELTLYIIELNKKNELQQKEIEKLQNK